MKIIYQSILFLSLVILSLHTTANEQKYVLPEADYRPETASKACFSGLITRVEESKIHVSGTNQSEKNVNLEIIIEKETSIFTVYGGYLSSDQLQKGIKLKIWFKGLNCDQPFQPITAARIMIASKLPGDDWPK